MAGDENNQYMSDPKNMEVYSINTICNYDQDIIPFLKSSVGYAFYRNKEGSFIQDINRSL